jgi:hypothetical protein
MPSRDLGTLALVFHVEGDAQSYTEVLVSVGPVLVWNCCDEDINGLMHCEYPNGIYVVQPHFVGSGEDVELELAEVRPLTAEECQLIVEDQGLEALRALWFRPYSDQDVSCDYCEKPLSRHIGEDAVCPMEE